MRFVALLCLAGCSFHPGTYSSDGAPGGGDDDSGGGDDDAPGMGSDACVAHVLPPSKNVDATQWSAQFLSAPSWNCNAAGMTTIDSTAGTATSTSCALGSMAIANAAQTTGGGNVLVIRLAGLSLTNGHQMRIVGNEPVVFLVAGDVTLDTGALIDVGARAATPGAGGSRPGECTDVATGLGTPGSNSGWGGGGGGYGTAGGDGAYNVLNGGDVHGSTSIEPLRGGCSGGISSGTASGAGGGAIEISASGTISVGATAAAVISVGGGGAPGSASGGGNGGGSGGAIVLVASTMPSIGAMGALRAHGGSGSEGCSSSCGGGNDDGGDAHSNNDTAALDASGTAGGGNGNDHGRKGGLASIVGTTITNVDGELQGMIDGGRGGGGGGGGRILIATGATTNACD